jgi:ribosomal protein L44E
MNSYCPLCYSENVHEIEENQKNHVADITNISEYTLCSSKNDNKNI